MSILLRKALFFSSDAVASIYSGLLPSLSLLGVALRTVWKHFSAEKCGNGPYFIC